MRTRIQVIANPISGRGKAGRLAPLVIRRLRQRGCILDYAQTRCRGDAALHASRSGSYDAIACVGGDGTVNEVLNGLPERAPPLAFIPAGTANVLAKELGLPWTVTGLADAVVDGRAVPFDVGIRRPDGRKFLLFAGAGFDSYVVEEFHRRRKGRIHMAQYLLWALKTFPSYRPPRLTVELDGQVVEREAAWVEVFNVSQFGGPLLFAPEARPDDGVFDIMIQRGQRRRDVVRILVAAFVSFLLRSPYAMNDVVFLRAKRIRIWSPDGSRVPLQIDGDPGGELPVDLEISPRSVRLLVPKRAAARVRVRRMRSLGRKNSD